MADDPLFGFKPVKDLLLGYQPAPATSAASIAAPAFAPAPADQSWGSQLLAAMGKPYDASVPRAAYDYASSMADTASGGLADLAQSKITGEPVEAIRARTAAARAELPPPMRWGTDAAAYVGGPGKILGPIARGVAGAGLTGAALEGAAAAGGSAAGHGEDLPSTIGSAALGGVGGAGAGVLGKVGTAIANRISPPPPMIYPTIPEAPSLPSSFPSVEAATAAVKAAQQPVANAAMLEDMHRRLTMFGDMPGEAARSAYLADPTAFQGPAQDAMAQLGRQVGNSPVSNIAVRRGSGAVGGLIGGLVAEAGLPHALPATAALVATNAALRAARNASQTTAARRAIENAYPALTGVPFSSPNPNAPIGELLRQATIGAGTGTGYGL